MVRHANILASVAALARALRRAAGGPLLASMLAGCTTFGGKSADAPVEVNVPPANYRAMLLEFLRNNLADPVGVRDAYISEPALKPVGADSRYVVCVRFNAKDEYGQYRGSKDRVAIFFAGKLNQFVPATSEQCGNAAYQRFPELEALKKS